MSAGGLPRVGETVRDKYELVRTLGEGGMAVVYEARQKDTGQRVAVKVLAPELSRNAELLARFDREARAVKRLRTRHVAHIIEIATTNNGLPFMAMDFLDGRDLASELELRKRLPIAEAVDYVLQTASAIHEAHDAGIVHRNLKPANLFLVDEGSERVVKVLDFGISKVGGEVSKLTGAGAVMGTVVYMSPEQVRSSTDVDRRADVWSLGVILYELLAGRAPFEGASHKIAISILSAVAPDIRTFAPEIPPPLATTLAQMLARDRAQRIPDMREVANALLPFVPPNCLGSRATSHFGEQSSRHRKIASMTMPLTSSRQLLQKTVPLGFSHPSAKQSPNTPPSPAAKAKPDRTLLIVLGVLLGLIAAAGLLLIGLAMTRNRTATASVPSATASAANTGASSATGSAIPAPPASGISSTPTTAPQNAPHTPQPSQPPRATRPDAGALKVAPSENPTHL